MNRSDTTPGRNGRERGGTAPFSFDRSRPREESSTLPHERPARHQDVLSVADAVLYLHLDESAPNDDAARELLNRFVRQGRIAAFTWGKTRLFHRRQLDEFVVAELAKLAESAIGADCKPRSK